MKKESSLEYPFLSVCIITYNHQNYIREAIEGVLLQRVNFSYEIIIADDCSTDSTREILLEYEKKYPHLFKLIFQKRNIGPARNWIDLLSKPQGKYIAYFEGDDYWIDENKLQKQVDFLENNISYSSIFHSVKVLHAHDNDKFAYPVPPLKTLSFLDILRDHYIPSSSLVFRNYSWVKKMPDFFLKSISGDIPFELLLACEGSVMYFDDEMSCYRRNVGSVTQQKISKTQMLSEYVWMYLQISKNVPFKYSFFVLLKAIRYKLSFYKYNLLEFFDK